MKLVSDDVKVEDVVMTVNVISAELVCSVDVDVASIDVFRFVDSAVGAGAASSISLVCMPSLGSVGRSSISAEGGGASVPSGPSRNGVPALRPS